MGNVSRTVCRVDEGFEAVCVDSVSDEFVCHSLQYVVREGDLFTILDSRFTTITIKLQFPIKSLPRFGGKVRYLVKLVKRSDLNILVVSYLYDCAR